MKDTAGTGDVAANGNNMDFTLASLYHVADEVYGTAATGAWCSKWSNKLTTAATYAAPHKLTARELFSKYNKCSW